MGGSWEAARVELSVLTCNERRTGFVNWYCGDARTQAPAGFVRYKDKPKTQAGPQGRPVQTYAQAPAQPVAQATAPANNVSFGQAVPANPEAF